jgi:glycosyltransferase involved in cell wall biosynthesis
MHTSVKRTFPGLPRAQDSHAENIQRPLRVCIATPDILGPIKNGGIGTAYANMAEVLASAGHEVTILYLLGNYSENEPIEKWQNFYLRKNIILLALPSSKVAIDAPNHSSKSYEVYLWFLSHQHDYDIVHFPEWRGFAYYTLVAKHQGLAFDNTLFCVGTHSPSLWHTHGSQESITQLNQLEIDFQERESVRLADVVISPSQYMLQWMLQHDWVLSQQCYVQPNLLPPKETASITLTHLKKCQPVTEIVFFGRLEIRKGLELFCSALDILPNALLQQVQITFLGKTSSIDGETSADYLQARLNQAHFRWQMISDKDRDAALIYLHSPGRLAVIASLVENSPYTVLECLANHIAFLASDVGGIKELIAPEDLAQICFKPFPQALAHYLENALTQGIPITRPAIDFEQNEKIWCQWHEAILSIPLPQAISPSQSTTQPWVSVCVAHFNRPVLLSQLLDSLRAQDYVNFEVILVDDGSTQAAAKNYLAKLEPEFKQRGWHIVYQENSYLGAARNTAAKHAKGEYLLFMDDDNYAASWEISTFVKVAQKTKVDILTCVMYVFEGNASPNSYKRSAMRYWLPLGAAVSLGFYQNCFGDANALIKRTSFQKIGGFTEDYGVGHEDWEFFARAVLQGLTLEVIPKPLFYYRIQAQSMLRTGNNHKNLQRNIRPYLDVLPPALRQTLLYAQGFNHLSPQYSSIELDNYWYSWSWWITRPLRAIYFWFINKPRERKPYLANKKEEERIIAMITNSASWRITAPLRWLRRKLNF